MFRATFLRILVLIAVLGAASASFAGGESYPDGIRPPLDEVLERAAADELVPVSVVLKERVSPERIRLARAGRSPAEARRAVVALLKSTARLSQSRLLQELRAREAEGRVARIRPLWIGNVIGVDAAPDVIRRLAALRQVDWINHNPKVDISLGDRFGRDGSGSDALPDDVTAIECGVDLMQAPRVWSELGLTGQGAVIAVIDSGVCWTHSDIANQVWVNPGEDVDGDGEVMDDDDLNGVDDDGNGFVDDLVGWDFDFNDNRPSDDNSHGSHVAGTVAGDGTAGTQAGMAPDAEIMIVRVGLTFADEVDVWNGMQYAADNGAHAISMSLGWPHNQNPDRATWRQNCDNTIDAGTALVIAAGNEGQGNEPDNVRTPGDVPRVITVGAHDCSQNAASFTSRGPVTWQDVEGYNDHPYPPGLIKPDVAGPGVSTQSHNVCSGYSVKSGTSMATPHVSGAVALMVSANPGLGHDEIKRVLVETAVDLGAAGKDNTFGAGMAEAYEAVNAVYGLAVDAVAVEDSDPDHGNDDGGIDTGELVTLRVTLRNQWDDRTATGIRGWVSSETPGVTLVHDWAQWPDVGPLETADSLAPHFSVRIEQGCNFPIEFQLTLRYNGRETRGRFSVRVGTAFDRTLIVNDFESDQGWQSASTAPSGQFVRVDPVGVQGGLGDQAQPEDDVTPAPGTQAWITGNDDQVAGDDDVDNGDTTIVSPLLDATDFDEATLHYSRWFYANPGTVPASDFFRAHWTRDGGATWNLLEELTTSGSEWVQVSVPLPGSAFGPGLQVRFQVDDPGSSAFDSVVEGGIDEVDLSGKRIECDTFVAPVVQAPNGIGETLGAQRANDNVRLEWVAPPVDGGHDAATAYRIYRSADPAGGFAVHGYSTETWHVEVDEALDPSSWFFVVVAENGGGTSDDVP